MRSDADLQHDFAIASAKKTLVVTARAFVHASLDPATSEQTKKNCAIAQILAVQNLEKLEAGHHV